MRPDGGERAVEAADRRGDERFSREITGVGHEVAGGEIVGTVGDEVVAADEIERIRRGQAHRMGFDRDVRVEPPDHRGRAVDLGPAEVRSAVDDLALQIGKRHGVVIDDAERADARGGEIQQHRRAEPAGADHEHPGAPQRELPRPADLAQYDVAGVALDLLMGQHRHSDAYIAIRGRLRQPAGHGAHRLRNFGARFSMKAAMPSFWSSVANSEWNTRRSKRTPSASELSNARFTDSFAIMTAGSECSHIVL